MNPSFFRRLRSLILIASVFCLSVPAVLAETGKSSSPGEIVLTINSHNVERGDLERRTDMKMREILAQSGLTNVNPRNEAFGAIRGQVEKGVADHLINKYLLLDAATAAGTKVTAEDVDSAFRWVTRSFPTRDAMKKALEAQGLTPEDLKLELKENLLIENYLKKRFSDITVSEKEKKAFYAENRSRFTRPESVHARHILVADDSSAAGKLAEIQKKLKEGVPFADLARQYSIGPSAKNGGDLGFFTRGRMVKPFEDAAFSTPVGKVSKPVKTRFGYHLILVEAHQAEVTPTYEEVKEKIEQLVKQEKTSSRFQALIAELRRGARIINRLESSSTSQPAASSKTK